MTKYELPCEIVQDLLPSYADGVTSETTAAAVEEHLTHCAGCSAVYDRMISPEAPEADLQDEGAVDFLKKSRKKGVRAAVLAGASAALAVLLAVFLLVFVRGEVCSPGDLDCAVSYEDGTVTVKGCLADGRNVSGVTFEEDGDSLFITVKENRLPFGTFSIDAFTEVSGEPEQILLNGQVVWQDGISVSDTAWKLFNLTNPYLGDFPADNSLLIAVDSYNLLGACTSELQTSEEPYSWTILGEDDLTAEDWQRLQLILPEYSAILLAGIGNLGSVSFDYTVDGVKTVFTYTQEQASALIGTDIHSAMDTPADTQRLLTTLESGSSAFALNSPDAERPYIDVNLRNGTADGIDLLSLVVFVNGDARNNITMCNADDTRMTEDTYYIGFDGTEYGAVYDGDLIEVEIIVTVGGKDYEVGTIPLELSDAEGGVLEIDADLTGSAEEGFALENIR